ARARWIRRPWRQGKPSQLRSPEGGEARHNIGIVGQRRRALSIAHGCAGDQGVQIVKDSARYAKIVEWSDEDHCYIGSAPDLIYGGCHGDDEKAVFAELC